MKRAPLEALPAELCFSSPCGRGKVTVKTAMRNKEDVLQPDFQIADGVGFAGVDIAILFICLAEHHTLGEKHSAAHQLDAAETALTAPTADIDPHTGPLQRNEQGLVGPCLDDLPAVDRDLEDLVSGQLLRPSGFLCDVLGRTEHLTADVFVIHAQLLQLFHAEGIHHLGAAYVAGALRIVGDERADELIRQEASGAVPLSIRVGDHQMIAEVGEALAHVR